MPRKPHPSDLFNAEVIAEAVEWSAFTRAGGRLVQHFGSRAEAKEAAGRMADHFQRPALVYAIDGNGRSAVADMIHPKTSHQGESIVTKITTKFANRFNAQRAARKALGIEAQEGVAFRTFKIEGGFAWEAIAPQPKRGRQATQVTPTAPHGKRAAIEDGARQGCLPTPPDFSAATHARFRAKLAKLVALAEAGDAEGLRAVAINPVSTSPKAMARYRDLAVTAIETRVIAPA